ncbi:hypothetical protein BDZ94DRAFT_1270272 [Collybia nuda]|uniref:Uncharacterized protein n=1 Tax=Collybia nuda TaxID=64659 RepID=A0A9P5XVV9_9AGAR|nr:hypothetical protein BDZ94DRAFT_1270272 [Collybia nuda]
MQSTSILQYSQSVSGQHYNSVSGSVLVHYRIKNLEVRGAAHADVGNTGWHRGSNNVRRHLTVRFLDENGRFITTQNIYASDRFYHC